MRIPQFNALRALEGVARLGSMTRTAQELHLTPSAISHALKLLEQEIGLPLVARDGRGVRLTKA
ncbi:MAG: LysR family transcriptional regulator, partial [Mesorhizobium sp.]